VVCSGVTSDSVPALLRRPHGPCPSDVVCKVVSVVVLTAFCHLCVLGGSYSINVALVYLILDGYASIRTNSDSALI